MLERGQLGRKTGGGFYKMTKNDDGSRSKETFDLDQGDWRPSTEAALDETHSALETLVFAETPEGRFAWDLMVGTLCYAADLVPEISDDIVNIDNAMRWGFGWKQGPFQMLDAIGPKKVIDKLNKDGANLPKMLTVLQSAGAETFYPGNGTYLGLDGAYHPLPGNSRPDCFRSRRKPGETLILLACAEKSGKLVFKYRFIVDIRQKKQIAC